MRKDKYIFALGFFDGVHLGHQALLRACCSLAEKMDCHSAAITFDDHPKARFSDQPPALLTGVADRSLLLRRYGIDHIVTFPVSAQVFQMRWDTFLEELMESGAIGFVCGDDFHFGHRGEGNAQKLQEFCARQQLPCIIIPEQSLNGTRISSTLIRSQIEEGQMETALQFLGHPHLLTGQVRHGQKLGRTLGVPTANLQIPDGVVVPRFGVYACMAHLDGQSFPAVANVGIRPTVAGSGITVEPWILDFSGDLYGQVLRLEFYRFLRPEQKFETLESLRRQIQKDAAETRIYFKTL